MPLLSRLQFDSRMQLFDGITAPLAAADLCHLLLSSSRHHGQPCFEGEVSTVIGGRSEEQVSVLQLGFRAVFDAKLPW